MRAGQPVFLDRDGVLNRRIRGGYVRHPGELELMPGVSAAVRRLGDAGHPVIVITNQSGIGRGLMTEADLARVHTALETRLGASLTAIYHCPHAPEVGCPCRKPGTELIERARRDLGLGDGGVLVGDSASDILAGRRAGLDTVLVSPPEADPYPAGAAAPDRVVADLAAAVAWILE